MRRIIRSRLGPAPRRHEPSIGFGRPKDGMVPRSMRLPAVLSVLSAVACAGRPSGPAPIENPSPAPAEPARPAPAVAPAPIDVAAIRDLSETRGYGLGAPKPVAVLPDGNVLFLRTEPRSYDAALYELTVVDGSVRKLAAASDLVAAAEVALSPAEKARRERTRTVLRGIVDVQVSDDGRTLLVPLGAQVFVFDRATGKSRALALGGGYPEDPRLSPDGKRLGFVRDGDLWVAEVGGGSPRRVTRRSGKADSFGIAEFVAQEELDRTRGYWWSPDSQSLVVQYTDESQVDLLYVADPARPDRAPTPFRYPRAGTANADVRLAVVSARGGKPTWITWDRSLFPYVRDVQWAKSAPPTIVVLNRLQTEARVLAVDGKTGATRVLVAETDPAWINVPEGPRWLASGDSFLWSTERSGAWQLEHRAATGDLIKTFDIPGFVGEVQVDDDAGLAWVSSAEVPTEAHLATVDLATGRAQPTASAPGIHAVLVGARGGTRVETSIDAGGSRDWRVIHNGALVGRLPSVAEEPPAMPRLALETVAVDGRDHHVAIVRPRDFDPARRYPVLLDVYAGPSRTVVWNNPRAYLKKQLIADAGFIVVAADGRGTPRRGRAWERAIKNDLISVALADQIGALQAVGAAHPELDLDRVGVVGWSFGGYFAAMAALLRPDVFKAAIAGAPVTDWRLYDTAYTERYLGLPGDNTAAYDATSAVKLAATLTRPLLLVHGLTDDNVYVANTLALGDALFRAGKPYELLALGSTHMMTDPVAEAALLGRQIEFFRAHLGLPSAR